jgi:hypothetical protein
MCACARLGADEPSPAAPVPPAVAAPAYSEAQRSLLADLQWLSASERGGRESSDDRAAVATWLSSRFREARLAPIPGHEAFEVSGGQPGAPTEYRNVIGCRLGARTADTPGVGEYLLVIANYDGPGRRAPDIVLPGADGNASGLVALLRLAADLARREEKLGRPFARSVVIAATDGKYRSLAGSNGLAAGDPLPVEDCAAVIVLEEIGRSMADLVPGLWMVLGTENSQELDQLTRALGSPEGGVAGYMGTYFHAMAGDYLPFRHRKVPHVFLSAGQSGDAGEPGDVPERMDLLALDARVAWTEDLVAQLADAPVRPTWREEGPPSLDEMKELQQLVALGRKGLEAKRHAGAKFPPIFDKVLEAFYKRLDVIVKSGTVTERDRRTMRDTLLSLSRFPMLMGRR